MHVSTAYSNPFLQNVEEKVYGTTADEDHQVSRIWRSQNNIWAEACSIVIQMFINGVGVLPEEELVEMLATRFQKRHPNTYTLTKHFAEQIVFDYHGKLPICIVRPSIVVAALSEPLPGWIDNFCGITGEINIILDFKFLLIFL